MMTARELSLATGHAHGYVLRLIEKGIIEGFKVKQNGQMVWMVDSENVQRYYDFIAEPVSRQLKAPKGYYTFDEAAKKTGYSRSHMFNMVRRGQIESKRVPYMGHMVHVVSEQTVKELTEHFKHKYSKPKVERVDKPFKCRECGAPMDFDGLCPLCYEEYRAARKRT